MIYAGIGSRESPPDVLAVMTRLGEILAKAGFTLRSGAARGADSAFEVGAIAGQGHREIFLPFPGFQGHSSPLAHVCDAALAQAARFHPVWDELNSTFKRLHGRNAYQVLGGDLNQKADLVICWTIDGCESHATRRRRTAGTGTAISIAEAFQVPVFNLCNESSRDALAKQLNHLPDVREALTSLRKSEPGGLQASLF